ncbi:hypothetical protein [Luteimonas terricola]|uniref:Uncharacterized protein n=1 Tax=Luteimonas terricola TaxID=645597 RepID=A0ABQ2EE76_9GAMM|nr:hypothetical protein [Luteimonas terricola]GGK08720.1 hypothetical protein GCM10011394_17640 [Luteimonas terricola]
MSEGKTRMRAGTSIATCTVALIALGAASCAITSGHHTGPNGQPVYFIDGMSAGTAYKKAQKLCPGGYNLIGNPRQSSPVDYVMTIECKGPAVGGSGGVGHTLDPATRGGWWADHAPEQADVPDYASWEKFDARKFARMEPRRTTRVQMAEMLGQPTNSMDLPGDFGSDQWIEGSQALGVIYKRGVLQEVNLLSSIDLSIAERQRLGL